MGLSDLGFPKSDFAWDAEVELGWRREWLHGRNHRPDHRSADGSDLDLVSLAANLWPGWQVTRQLTFYAGGGVGVGYARALGGEDWALFWQLGAGARWNVTPELSLELGERTVWLDDVRLHDYRATYDAVHGFTLGLRWEFKQ